MYQIFIDRGVCLREHSDTGPLLIFPSYFKRERPDITDHPATFVAFTFRGSLDEIYATLVVRLLHTKIIQKDALWKWAADFRTPANKRLGIKMDNKGDGVAELAVYFDPEVSDDVKITFARYVYEHLRSKDPDVTRTRYYVCTSCSTPVEGLRAIQQRKDRGYADIVCSVCEARISLDDLMEEKFRSQDIQDMVRKMELEVRTVIDNESKELILVGHAFSISGQAGQIFRPTPNSDWGIDGEIEFKDENGKATGKRVYLQLKSGDSYLRTRVTDGKVLFRVANERHLEYWQSQNYPVMLVVRTSDDQTKWMDVSRYLRDRKSNGMDVEFEGEPFNAASLLRLRDKQLSLVGFVETVATQAGHVFRVVRQLEWGIDGEIELRGPNGEKPGVLLLQLRPDVSYKRRSDEKGTQIFSAEFPGRFGQSNFPKGRVMLVARSSVGQVQWMDVTAHLKRPDGPPRFNFVGTRLTPSSINNLRDKLLGRKGRKHR